MIKKLRADELDEFETEYVDIDMLLSMYVEEFKIHRRITTQHLMKLFNGFVVRSKGIFTEFSMALANDVVREAKPKKIAPLMLKFCGSISLTRAMIHAFMSGNNNNKVEEFTFI